MVARLLTVVLSLLTCAPLAGSAVVFTEIMYHPDSEHELEEYAELQNIGDAPVDLLNWSVSDGITATVTVSTILAPGARAVLARDAAGLAQAYPGVEAAALFEGRLSNGGERISLHDAAGALVDTIEYGDSEPWSPRSDGGGPSLECLVPTSPNADPANWRASVQGTRGTPGALNSVNLTAVPPLLTELAFTPEAPAAGQALTITVRVQGPVTSVTLVAAEQSPLTMNDGGVHGDAEPHDGVWTALIPAVPGGERLRWYVEALGANGAISRAPEYAPLERHGLYVPTADEPRDLVVWRLWLDPADLAAIRANPQSDITRTAALAIGRTYFEPVQIRPRGNLSRSFPKLSWKIFLPEWHEHQGEQTFNLNGEYTDPTMLRESLAHLFYTGLGYAASETEHVRVLINGVSDGVHLRVENIGRRWLENHGLSRDADLFAARRGMFQDPDMALLKRRWDREIDATGEEGWQRLLAATEMIHDGSTSSKEWANLLEEHFDTELLFDYLAMRACAMCFDDKNKNVFLHALPTASGPRWMFIPYDLDLSLGRMFLPEEPDALFNRVLVTDLPAVWSGFPPDDMNFLYQRIASEPALLDQVYRRIGRIMENDFRIVRLGPHVDAMHASIRQAGLEDPLRWGTDTEFLSGPEEIKKFIRLRRESLAREVPAEYLMITPDRLTDHVLGIEPLVGNEWQAANFNGDGEVDISDVVGAARAAQPQ